MLSSKHTPEISISRQEQLKERGPRNRELTGEARNGAPSALERTPIGEPIEGRFTEYHSMMLVSNYKHFLARYILVDSNYAG